MQNQISPIKKRRLSEQVMESIKNLIMDGVFKPGDKLPKERDLAEQLEVSRASVREALRSLENVGFIESKVGSSGGTFVKQITLDSIMDPFFELLSSEKQVMLEMLEFRLVIETAFARLAAERRTDEDLQKIKDSLLLMERDIDNHGIGLDGDNSFHDEIAAATHNTVFVNMLRMSRKLLVKIRETTLMIKGQPALSLKDHWEIYEAIENQDLDKAEAVMREHIIKAQKNIGLFKVKDNNEEVRTSDYIR